MDWTVICRMQAFIQNGHAHGWRIMQIEQRNVGRWVIALFHPMGQHGRKTVGPRALITSGEGFKDFLIANSLHDAALKWMLDSPLTDEDRVLAGFEPVGD